MEKIELTMQAVRSWIEDVATGKFHYTKVLNGTVNPRKYGMLREYVGRCCKLGICESQGLNDGWYRPP